MSTRCFEPKLGGQGCQNNVQRHEVGGHEWATCSKDGLGGYEWARHFEDGLGGQSSQENL